MSLLIVGPANKHLRCHIDSVLCYKITYLAAQIDNDGEYHDKSLVEYAWFVVYCQFKWRGYYDELMVNTVK